MENMNENVMGSRCQSSCWFLFFSVAVCVRCVFSKLSTFLKINFLLSDPYESIFPRRSTFGVRRHVGRCIRVCHSVFHFFSGFEMKNNICHMRYGSSVTCVASFFHSKTFDIPKHCQDFSSI